MIPTATAAPGFAQDAPAACQAPTPEPDALNPLAAILFELRETNRLLAALVAQNEAASQRQNPGRYQTVAGGKG